MRNVDPVAPVMSANVAAAPLAVVCCHWKRNAPTIPLASAMPDVFAVSVVNTGMSCAVLDVIVAVPVGGVCGAATMAVPLIGVLATAFVLLVVTSVADLAAAGASGRNATFTTQLCPAGSVAPHVVAGGAVTEVSGFVPPQPELAPPEGRGVGPLVGPGDDPRGRG